YDPESACRLPHGPGEPRRVVRAVARTDTTPFNPLPPTITAASSCSLPSLMSELPRPALKTSVSPCTPPPLGPPRERNYSAGPPPLPSQHSQSPSDTQEPHPSLSDSPPRRGLSSPGAKLSLHLRGNSPIYLANEGFGETKKT